MNIAIIGGTGAMGSIFGGRLQQAGNNVTLYDVSEESVNKINSEGLRILNKEGVTDTITINATTDAASISNAELAIIFVKCFHTEAAVTTIAPYLNSNCTVLTLQNGWGNAATISNIIGNKNLLIGVNYISGTILEPGYVKQVGNPMAYIGRWNQPADDIAKHVADLLTKAGVSTTASDNTVLEIWKKLALNVCTLPTSALLNFEAHKLVAHDSAIQLMEALLKETAAVALAENIALDFDERLQSITGLLKNAVGARSSMLQDVQAKRRTEIDVINGAIVAAAAKHNIVVPFNQSMVWSMQALEAEYLSAK